MNIQVNTDHNIEGSEELNDYIGGLLRESFGRYASAITTMVVHLSDVNAGKSGDMDKKCLIEVRVSHHQPLAVSHNAESIHEAVQGASDKLLRSVDTMIGKSINRTSPKDLIEENPVDFDEEELT